MTRTFSGTAALVAMATMVCGCLQKEDTHTLCLSPDGAVTWVATENAVYSDLEDPAARRAEERTYLARALGGRHEVALALDALAPLGEVRTSVLRGEAPFFVITEARFASIDQVMRRLFEGLPAPVAVTLERDGRRTELAISIDFGVDVAEANSPATELLTDLDRFRIVMTSGRFVSATGFDLARGVTATFSEDWLKNAEKVQEEGGTARMLLAWEP